MRSSIWSVFLCLVASFLPSFTQAGDPHPPLELKIAIPVHHNHRSLNTGDHFHVLVKNVSETPLRLWSDRYSWGYDNLSFEQIGDGGKTVAIRKRPHDWDKNFPDWLELQPGDTFVLNVNFAAASIWDKPPTAGAGKKPTQVKLRAVYEVTPDEQSIKLGVWTGKIQSAVDTYAIW